MAKFKGLELLREESESRDPGTESAQEEANSQQNKPKRPIGKRQNPDYQQISAYVRKDIYDEIRRELVGKSKDFSDLLEEWMQHWLRGKNTP